MIIVYNHTGQSEHLFLKELLVIPVHFNVWLTWEFTGSLHCMLYTRGELLLFWGFFATQMSSKK